MSIFSKSLLIVAVGCCEVGVAADQPRQLLTCWDQTFAYDTFSIEETRQHYFISFKGAMLPGRDSDSRFELFDWGDSVVFEGRGQLRLHLTAAFPKDKCSWYENAKSIHCAVGTPDAFNNTIYVTRQIGDLGDVRTITTRFSTGRIEVLGGKYGIVLTKIETGSQPELQKLEVQNFLGGNQSQELDCDNSGQIPDARVPQRLVDFLE